MGKVEESFFPLLFSSTSFSAKLELFSSFILSPRFFAIKRNACFRSVHSRSLSVSLSLSLSTLILAVSGETPFLPVGEKKEGKKREGK